MRKAVADAKDAGRVSQEDFDTFNKFVGATGHPSYSLYIMARTMDNQDIASNPGFQATVRVMNSIGLG
jgi:hypothetical protein